MLDTLTNTIAESVIVAELPWATAVARRGDRVYVANMGSDRLSVIDTTT
jgi:DNA-binding beta-propeller fold protein YncE